MNNMKFSKALIYLLIFECLIMLRVDLLFVSQESASMNLMRLIVIGLGIISCGMVCLQNRLRKKVYGFAKNYILIITLVVVFFVIYTKNLYGYTWYQAFSLSIPFLYNYEAAALIYLLDRETKYKKLLFNVIIYVTVIFLVIRFIAWFSYNYLPIRIFENFATENLNWIRNGLQRVIGGQLFGIAYVLLLRRFMLNENARLKWGPLSININLIYILTFMGYSLFVVQLRYQFVVLAAVFFICLYFKQKKVNNRKFILVVTSVMLALVVVSGGADKVISGFSLSGKYGLSTLARLESFKHFYELFITTGHGVGLGFLTNGYGTESLFYRTSWLNYYLDDLGIVQAFFRYGLFSLLIYGYLFFKAVSTAAACYRRKSDEFALILPTVVYMILICILYNIYDAQNAFGMPFYIAVISYVNGKNHERSEVESIEKIKQ